MELHQLRYVAAVAQTGNFSRAAEHCHVSQPSLSQQIQKLEEELGERLFDRLRRHAQLTTAGERFLPRALRILEEMDAAQREAQSANDLTQGEVAIGVLPTIAPYLLPPAIKAFSAKFPGLQIEVHEDTTARLLKMAAACDVDLVIASPPIHDDRFEEQEIFREELLLAMPEGHPFAKRAAISMDDLTGERFIVMKEGHCLGDQVLSFCHNRDLHPQISFRSAQIETLQSLVQAGMGISLVPEMAVQVHKTGLVYRSLQKPQPERTIAAFWPRQRPPGRAAAEWLKVVTEVVRHLGDKKTALDKS